MSSSSRIVIKPRERNSDIFLQTSSVALVSMPFGNPSAAKNNMPKRDDVKDSKRSVASSSNQGPRCLVNRVIALKNLQLDFYKMKTLFFEELHNLESKYNEKCQGLYERRQKIINDNLEPAMQAQLRETEKNTPSSNRVAASVSESDRHGGVPNFWLAVLLNTPLLRKMIKKRDLLPLSHLEDLRVRYFSDRSFMLEFHFGKNEHFSNPVLKKKYYQTTAIDENDPFSYDGPEIFRAEGCSIYWKPNMNLTISNMSANAVKRGMPDTRRRSRRVESFFNFFNPPQFPLEKVVVDMELERVLTIDFEIGNFLRKRVVPMAYMIYKDFLRLDDTNIKSSRNNSADKKGGRLQEKTIHSTAAK